MEGALERAARLLRRQMRLLILEVVLRCPKFLPLAFRKIGKNETSVQEKKASPEMNRGHFSRFSTMRALNSPHLCQGYFGLPHDVRHVCVAP